MNTPISRKPHAEQRYDTCGDWQFDPETDWLRIIVSRLPDRRYEALLAFHEFAEGILCVYRGITTEMVDAFDMAYEAARRPGDESEPGDAPGCPCRAEHFFATTVERMLARELGVDWTEYEKALYALSQEDT